MDNVKCPISGGPANFYCNKPPVDYYISKRNGLIFQREIPTPEEMVAYADNEYESGLYKNYVLAADLKYKTFEKRIELIKKYVSGGRLLDVGCSSGFFIETAIKHGFDAYGMEFSKQAIKQAKPEIQDRITNGDINLIRESGKGEFDIIVAFDVIEHTHDPVRFLIDLQEVLSPGGWLILSTPDTGHFLRYLMGSRWPMLQPLQHTFLFSKQAMQKALDLSGYNILQVQNSYKTLTLEYLAGQISLYNPLLTRFYKILSPFLPGFICNQPFSVNIGEMLVVGQKRT